METPGQLHGYSGMKAQLLVDNGVGGAFWKTPRRMAPLPKLDGMDSADEDPSSAYQTTHTGTTAANSSLLQVPVAMSGS